MMIKMLLVKFAIVSALLGAFSGCVWVESTDDLVAFVIEVQKRASRPIKLLPAFVAYEAFVYEGASLRNPFVKRIQYVPETIEDQQFAVDLGDTPAPDEQRLKTYLEGFAIKDLSMVGNISKGSGGAWALIVDPNGEIHRVSIGDYIGMDYGKVISVDVKKIKLLEVISNGRGGWVVRPQRIAIVELKDV